MPSKNKNIIRRIKTRKQHRSRKHKRNNNNERNQTIRGGFRWPWRKPTPTLMATLNSNPNFLRKTPQRTSPTLMETLKSNPNFLKKTPQRTSPSSPPQRPSQPRLPTNVDPVKKALREDVSRGNREVINELKKLIEPQNKKMKALAYEYKILGERKDKTEDLKERHEIFVKRQKIHNEIAQIKREKIGRSRVEDIQRDIRTRERADVKYREDRGLPELPSDDDILLDADIEMEKVDGAAGVFGLVLDKAAVNTDVLLDAQRRRADAFQRQFDETMSGVSGSPRDSVETQRGRIDKVVDEVTRGVSGPRSGSSARGSSARGSSAHDAPLPPPHGLPSGRRARDSSARGSRRSPSP